MIANNIFPIFTGTHCSVSILFLTLAVVILTAGRKYFLSSDSLKATTTISYVSNAVSTSPPNFIVIIADDLGWDSLGYGSNEFQFASPFITSLAKTGVIVENFYGQEVCSPSRAALMTGRYPVSVGMQYRMVSSTIEWGLDIDEVTVTEALSINGYSNHLLGKWHLGHFTPMYLPTARGFDTFIGYLNGETYYFSKHNPDFPEYSDLIQSNTECYSPYLGPDKHVHSTLFYQNKSLSIINGHDYESNALFLMVSFQAVHSPFVDVGDGVYKKGLPDEFLPEVVDLLFFE